MKLARAVLTAAGPGHRALPLQTLVDRDGQAKSVFRLLVDTAARAGSRDVCVVVDEGGEAALRNALGPAEPDVALTFVVQREPRGYGHALLCAREFTRDEAFLHLVVDHLLVDPPTTCSARRLVEIATAEDCAVSAVQPTRETELPRFGAVAGQLVPGRDGLYEVARVREKPTPTVAEQELIVPGLRAGHYLCFHGMHVLTPAVLELLAAEVADNPERGGRDLSTALGRLADRERYLAWAVPGRRFDLAERWGLLGAQLALALTSDERDVVLARLVDVLAQVDRLRADGGAAP